MSFGKLLTRKQDGKQQLQERLQELEAEIQSLRDELAQRPRTLSDEERLAVIEKARAELPALDKQVDESLEELRRLAAR
jgi:septal ring factor EnvC (AmiA/AmiB activator)